MTSIVLDLAPFIELSDDQFYQLCQNHRDLRFERNAQGELIIMPPLGGEGGRREADLIIGLGIWNQRTQMGQVFSSSTGFKLPNGAERSPDAAWVAQERWERLSPAQQKKFPPLCPDFAIELSSESDALPPLQREMQEYLDNALRLGWLIDPQQRQVEIYRSHRPKEVRQNPSSLDGENVLPGFRFDLSVLWGQ